MCGDCCRVLAHVVKILQSPHVGGLVPLQQGEEVGCEECRAVHAHDVHGGIVNLQGGFLRIGDCSRVGVSGVRNLLLGDGDGGCDCQPPACIGTEDVGKVAHGDLSIGWIEILIVDGIVTYLDGDEQAGLGRENIDVGEVLKEEAARRK